MRSIAAITPLFTAGLVLALACLVCTGCSTTSTTTQPLAAVAPSATQSRWIEQQGGLAEAAPDNTRTRADAAFAALAASLTGHSKPIRLHVLSSDKLTAFAWPRGDIYLSRGLIRSLNQDELAAAIAHEMGHLLSSGPIQSVVALEGAAGADDHEQQADAVGVKLLAECDIAPAAMITMLEKVRNAQPVDSRLRTSLQVRIDALHVHR